MLAQAAERNQRHRCPAMNGFIQLGLGENQKGGGEESIHQHITATSDDCILEGEQFLLLLCEH